MVLPYLYVSILYKIILIIRFLFSQILFNLAHSYLKTTNINDEQEKKSEDNEKEKIIKNDIQQNKKEETTGIKHKKNVKKKKKKKSDTDNEIELYLQLQVDSKYQQQLCTKVQNEDLNKASQKPEIEIELKIEIPKELKSSYNENVDIEKYIEENVKNKSQKKNSIVKKQELINREIRDDSEVQNNTEKEITLNINKDVLVEFEGQNISCCKTQNQIQKGVEIKSQEKSNSDISLELELKEQQNMHDNLLETLQRSIQRRIERLICQIPLKNQKIEKELRQEIEELNKEIKELDPANVNELNKEILEEVTKKNYLPVQVNFLKNLYLSFNQDLTPFYNKLDQLSNDIAQTNIQKKLNEEFLKKLDSLLQQKCNEETQEEHKKVNNKVKYKDNDDVKSVKEKKLKLIDESKKAIDFRNNDKIGNNKKIKNKESQHNVLKGIQKGINEAERIQNQFKETDEKEKYQYYDLVIQYNQEKTQDLKGHAQHVLGNRVSVDVYDDAVKSFINQIDQDALKAKICNEEVVVIDQTNKKDNRNVNFQLEFYKSVEVEKQLQNKNQKRLQNYFDGEINRDLEIKNKETMIEVQEDSDVEIEDFEEKLQDYSVIENDEHSETIQENTKLKIGASEKAIIEDSRLKIGDSEKEVQEDSDVDIEGFEGEILEFPDVKIEDFDEESQENTDLDVEDVSEEEFNDRNEVVEIMEDIEEDIEVESNCSNSSVENSIPSEKTPTTICNESYFTINPDSKLKYDEEENLKIIDSANSTIMLTDHIKEQQKFFKLKHQLDDLSQEYKGYVQQRVLNKLQQEVDDKQLQEMKIFPDTFNEVKLNTDEDFQKEIDELQSELYQLEPEYMRDEPYFEVDNASQKLKEKPYDLFEKLHSIHRKQLCKFGNSKEWPERVNK